MIGNSDDEANFPHKLLFTNRQVANLRKAFANYTSTAKMIQSGRFIGRLLGPLLKTALSLMKSVIQPLAKNVLISSGLTTCRCRNT